MEWRCKALRGEILRELRQADKGRIDIYRPKPGTAAEKAYIIEQQERLRQQEAEQRQEELRRQTAKEEAEKKSDRRFQLLNTLLSAFVGSVLTLLVEHFDRILSFFFQG